MKISKWPALIVFFMLIPAFAHSDNYTDKKDPPTTLYIEETGDEKPEVEADTSRKTQGREEIKAESICIGEDCRSKWPGFKCETYDNRPVGETGDEFCAKMNKTCVAVFIGGGQSFFDECSIPVNSVHKCRCCGVE